MLPRMRPPSSRALPPRLARMIEAASTSERSGTSPAKLWSKRFSVMKSGTVKPLSSS
ncbi:MAG: hypothetical protein ACJ74T_22855 [Pyrinomonadaceae bacterium]